MVNIIEALRQTTTSIRSWVDENKVQKISGKGLSTNDYTTAEKNKVASIPNDLMVIDSRLYLAQDGIPIQDSAVTLPSGGGGGSGSGGGSSSVTVKNLLDSNSLIAAIGQSIDLEFSFISSETIANGTAYIYVNDILKATTSIISGKNKIDISPYVVEGINSIKLNCIDIYSNPGTLFYTVEVIELKLSSAFDATIPYEGAISYTYTPTANVDKIVHFKLDGKEIGTQTVTTSGRQQTYVIPKQSHGSHTFEVYFTVNTNGKTVPSNHLYYDLMFITSGVTTPIISCAYNNNTITQFETIVIPYIVYSPTAFTSDITLCVNGNVINELTVDRTKQNWSFRPDTYGQFILTINCGAVTKTLTFNVEKSDINVQAVANDLELYLSSYGRSNSEKDPANWSYGDIETTFSNFNFISDGWQLDEDGVSVLRVSGDARLTIPAKIFANDFRTTGKTIEVEFSTKEVFDYETTIFKCMFEGRGIQITAQRADLFSEQSTIGTQYKENEHIRLSFVVEKKGENRFLLVYINGILSGSTIYPEQDNFTQAEPADIFIGSNYCTTDIYCIRVYNNNLTRYDILDNWIADTQNASLMIERYSRNQIYDSRGMIAISKLPVDLPYLIIEAAALPVDKEDDKKTCSGSYVDVMNPEKSFTFQGASLKVQGTSSQYYYVKNYKIKFKKGFEYSDGTTSDVYQLNDNSIGTNVFTFKADVASSEGANNVVLAQLYNDLCPVLTPPQQKDSRVRQAIDGHPIIVFWNNGSEIKFLGKYNFNHDKGAHEIFGFSEGDESWEIRQNGTELVGWKSDDFSGDWTSDFEARYPEDNTNITNLQALASWLKSTNIEAATDEPIESVTYNESVIVNSQGAYEIKHQSTTYTQDSVLYRLAKFRNELPEHANIDAMVFYYLITEITLGIDQREKNAFPTLFDEMGKWIMFYYDADTTLGIDNKGKLAFSPYLEDIDYLDSGDPVYNGQNSVLWANLRKTYYLEITNMYKDLRETLRNDGTENTLISYDVINGLFEQHQGKWCEAIFNEDMYRKCLEPMIISSDSQYLPMLLGKKEMQRKWWLYNRFRYLDSKYVTGNSMKTRIIIRAKSKADISLTPYINMYGHVYYNDTMVEHRMDRGKSYKYEWSHTGAEDPVIGINDADMLTSLGDLSPLHVETIDISKATHLTSLKIGDASSSYSNKSLTSVTFGNNTLLSSIDLRRCESLNVTLDVSKCLNIEEIYCTGTSITGISLPDGGILKTLHLPNTITNLTICNQPSLSNFVLEGSSKLTTLRLENVGALIDAPSVIRQMPNNSRIRALGIDWEVESETDLMSLLNKLNNMTGMDEQDNNLNNAVLTGRIRVNDKVSDQAAGSFYDAFPDVVIDDGSEEIYVVNYKDRDGRVLYSTKVAEGANAIDPIAEGIIETPEPLETETYLYEFTGWSELPTNIKRNYVIIAQYHTKFAIKFYNGDERIYSQWSIQGDAAEDPVANGKIPEPTKTGTDDIQYKFAGWDNLPTNVQETTDVHALYDTYYPVRFYQGDKAIASELHETVWTKAGTAATPPAINPEKASTKQYQYTFSQWNGSYTNIQEATNIYAEYTSITRKYTVYFCNGSDVLHTAHNITYANTATYVGDDPVKQLSESDILYGYTSADYQWTGKWSPEPTPNENTITTKGTGANKEEAVWCYPVFKFIKVNTESWDTIANNVATLADEELFQRYPIGTRKNLTFTIDGTDYNAVVEIIAHNHDDLTGGGKAKLTFFTNELPDLQRPLVITREQGWYGCGLRAYLNDILFNALPGEGSDDGNLQGAIKEVVKAYNVLSPEEKIEYSNDKCWTVSDKEAATFTYDAQGNIQSSYPYAHTDGQGNVYSNAFSDNTSRKRHIYGGSSENTVAWWTRSLYDSSTSASTMAFYIGKIGAYYGHASPGSEYSNNYVAFGFCI